MYFHLSLDSSDLFKQKRTAIVQGEKGLVLFNFCMMTQGTTAFLSSFSVLFIEAGNLRLV